MRIWGGLLSWILPNRLIRGVTESPSVFLDTFSHLIGFFASFYVTGYLMELGGVPFSGSSVFGTFLGSILLAPLTLLTTLALTWMWHSALSRSNVNGVRLTPSFSSLFAGHLHIYALLLPAAFLALVTSEVSAIVIFTVAFVRTIDLEARVIRDTCTIPLSEAYKGTLMILVVYGITAVFATWLTSSFFE
jgi:hypothetical protein